MVDARERLKTVSSEDAQRLREDSLRLKEERREEVQIVSDSKVTLKPMVKTEASEMTESPPSVMMLPSGLKPTPNCALYFFT